MKKASLLITLLVSSIILTCSCSQSPTEPNLDPTNTPNVAATATPEVTPTPTPEVTPTPTPEVTPTPTPESTYIKFTFAGIPKDYTYLPSAYILSDKRYLSAYPYYMSADTLTLNLPLTPATGNIYFDYTSTSFVDYYMTVRDGIDFYCSNIGDYLSVNITRYDSYVDGIIEGTFSGTVTGGPANEKKTITNGSFRVHRRN